MSATADRAQTQPPRRNSEPVGSSRGWPAMFPQELWKHTDQNPAAKKPSMNEEDVLLSSSPPEVCYAPVSGCCLSASKGKQNARLPPALTCARGSPIQTPSRPPTERECVLPPPVVEECTFGQPSVMHRPTDPVPSTSARGALDLLAARDKADDAVDIPDPPASNTMNSTAAGETTDGAVDLLAPPDAKNPYIQCQSPFSMAYKGDGTLPKTLPGDYPRAVVEAVDGGLPAGQTPLPSTFGSPVRSLPPPACPLFAAKQCPIPVEEAPQDVQFVFDPYHMIHEFADNICAVLNSTDADDKEAQFILQGAFGKLASIYEVVLCRPPPLFLHNDRREVATRSPAPVPRPDRWAEDEVALLPAALVAEL